MDALPQFQILGKIVIAGLLAGLVGLEREFADRPAGLRTHMLVGATSALIVLLSQRAIAALQPVSSIKADPVQIIQAIIIGVSFLGAGTIFKDARQDQPVQGLTTGASILSVAAVGIAVAFDAYIVAVGVTLWDLLINWALNALVLRIKRSANK